VVLVLISLVVLSVEVPQPSTKSAAERLKTAVIAEILFFTPPI